MEQRSYLHRRRVMTRHGESKQKGSATGGAVRQKTKLAELNQQVAILSLAKAGLALQPIWQNWH